MLGTLLAPRVATSQSNASAGADVLVLENPASHFDERLVVELFWKVLTDANLERNWVRKKFSASARG